MISWNTCKKEQEEVGAYFGGQWKEAEKYEGPQ